ncbi:MAG: hypothetical protein HYU39_11070 [Thaumarchaeota archaeon]|nr:hypothetical protein [Nitrososphaerota archaeon]
MKEKMRKAGINWSEELRKSIERRLAEKDMERSKEELDQLLCSVKPGFNTTLAIKETRRRA